MNVIGAHMSFTCVAAWMFCCRTEAMRRMQDKMKENRREHWHVTREDRHNTWKYDPYCMHYMKY
jgi:hypothetical protein